MTKKKTLGDSKIPQLSRHKYWHEMNDKEKFNTLAQTVDTLWNRCKFLEDAVERLKAHEHNKKGDLVVRFAFDRANENLMGYRYDPFHRHRGEGVPVGDGLF